MDLFQGVLPFLQVAEQKSFRKAAEALNVSTAAVSKSIAKLESELGVALVSRNTRAVSLTPEGTAFYERARDAVVQLRAAREAVTRARSVPEGTLRVTMPLIFSRLFVPELAQLTARHPRIALHVAYTDRYVRLVDEEIDVAIRVGQLNASELIARRLRRPRWVTVASPAYLAQAGTPKHVNDLASHRCICYANTQGGVRRWTFAGDDGDSSGIPQKPLLVLNHGELLVEAALADMGITQVLDVMVARLLRDRRLVAVLEDQAAMGPPVHAVYLPRRQAAAKVTVFLEAVDRVLG